MLGYLTMEVCNCTFTSGATSNPGPQGKAMVDPHWLTTRFCNYMLMKSILKIKQ